MKKILNFDTPYPIVIEKETVGAINLRVKAINSPDGGTTLTPAPIVDLNKIQIEVTLQRRNGQETKIMRGNLADNMIGLFSQTVKYELNRKSTADGYFHFFDFNPYAIALGEGDKLMVNLTVGSAAYDSVRKLDSLIEFETIQVKDGSNMIPTVRSYPIGKDKEFIDMHLGNQVSKVVVLTDLKETYLDSTEAKITLGSLKARGLNKDFTNTSLFVQNLHMFNNNPESPVEDLVVYQGKPLDDVKLTANLSKPALETAKVIVVAWERI